MDYLRNLGSALVQKSGLNLPFTLGQKVSTPPGIWNLYEGTKRDDSSAVSVFECDISDPAKKKYAPLAKNTLRKLRTTRHPDVLKFIDAVETESIIYIITERVRPLSETLPAWTSKSATEREDWLIWGLHRISVAVAFINDSCASTHGNISVDAIFISPSGEWKLGGFELISNPKDEAAVLYTYAGILPGVTASSSPEVKKSGWSDLKQYDPAVADAYALGLLLHAVFNPNQGLPATATSPHPPPQPSSRGSIPTAIFPSFKKLLNPNHKARLSPKAFLELGMIDGGFFAENRLVKVCAGLDNFALSNEAEKNTFLRNIKESANSFPTEFTSYRVLPSLVSALEYGGASAATITPLVLQFGQHVPPTEYSAVILAPLVKLFASPHRGTRMALLDHLSEYADKLDKKIVGEKIWPHLQLGFSDNVAVIREAHVRSVSLLAPKLSDRILNNELLRHLAKMQMDPEPSIRTNTCILIGRLGPTLGYNTKRKVLVPAFVRALKDPFVHARVAGVMALMATVDCFEIDDLASKVIPNLCPSLIDGEKLVRDQAFKAIAMFVQKLEAHAATMPETLITEPPAGTEPSSIPYALAGANGSVVNSATGAAGALAGWAISSLGKRLAVTDMQSVMISAAGASIERALSAPPPPTETSQSPNMLSVPTLSGDYTSASRPSKAKGMQLGSTKVPSSVLAMHIAAEEEIETESDAQGENPWGTDDLIDVDADQDDWSAFETAPISEVSSPVPRVGLAVPTQNETPVSTPRKSAFASTKTTVPLRGTNSLPATTTAKPSDEWEDDSAGWGSGSTPHSPLPPTTPSVPSTVGMTKEEKAAEMARRKEERKQRIAHLKEQKKNAAKS